MRNKRLKKTVSVLTVFLILIVLVPVQVFGSDTSEMVTTDSEGSMNTYMIPFDKIQEEVLAKSPDTEDNQEVYNESDNGIVANYTLDKANLNVVWEVQNDFFEYNDLQKQLNASKAKKTLLEYEYKLMEVKASYGVATKEELLVAEKNVTDQNNTIESIENQIDNILEDFRYHLDLDKKANIIIGSVPYQSVQFSKIDYNSDLFQGLSNSYDVSIAAWNDDNSSVYYDTVSSFKSSFKTAYNNLKSAVEKVDYDERYFTTDRNAFKLAEIKYKYGSITKLDYLTEEYNYLCAQISNDQDKNDLYKAYVKYEWAKKGLIVN
ncbi:MAG: TolC family protein [Dehalobacter sp.]|nr:TolC family protein [Dehalobacter sp.]